MSRQSLPPIRGGSFTGRLAGIGRLSLLALLASSAACADAASSPLAQEEPSGIVLSLNELNLAAGDTTRILAVVVGSSGTPIASPSAGTAKAPASRITWQSSNPAIADVSQSGLVQAKQSGSAILTVSAGNLKRQSSVKVNGTSRSVVISPKVDTLGVGQTKQFSASVLNNGGNPTGDAVTWESSNSSVASVDTIGRVLAKTIGVALIIAQGGSAADTATVVVEPARQTAPAPQPDPVSLVSTVTVAPASVEIAIGQTAQFTASLRDAAGNVLTGRTIAWSTSNTSVATVSTTGLATAKGAGLASISATVDGVSGTAVVAVPQPAAAPGGSAVEPWIVEDFSSYRDSQAWLDFRSERYKREPMNPSQHVIDKSTGVGNLTQSLRYDFPDRTAVGTTTGRDGYCSDYSIGRDMWFPAVRSEVWTEVYVKFSENFVTRAPISWGCQSNADLKWFFGNAFEKGRFEVKIGKNGTAFAVGAPEAIGFMDVTIATRASEVWDGKWHRIRTHWKTGTGDGSMRVWLNDKLIYSQLGGIDTTVSDRIWGLRLGANLNQGPAQPQSYWWGSVKVWDKDPGW
jgi:uncharacterized protein YjdB